MAEIYRMTVRGETAQLDPRAFTARDGALVRRATREAGIGSMSLLGVLRSLGAAEVNDLDLLAVVWWLARRQGGTSESLADVIDAFPTYGEMDDDAVKLEAIDPTDEADDADAPALGKQEAIESPLG